MKFAIFGDVHANLEALDAVLADAEAHGTHQFACVGDLVGYGTDPQECIARLRALDCPIVKGDFDEGATIDGEITGLNPTAQAEREWTRAQLSENDRHWLRDLQLVCQVSDFTIVHASLDCPEQWVYVMNDFDAMASFRYQQSQLCFFGHTHKPLVYIKKSDYRRG